MNRAYLRWLRGVPDKPSVEPGSVQRRRAYRCSGLQEIIELAPYLELRKQSLIHGFKIRHFKVDASVVEAARILESPFDRLFGSPVVPSEEIDPVKVEEYVAKMEGAML